MRTFNNGGNFNRRDSGSRGGRGGGNFGRPEMYKAICAECGENCEVPFKPTGDKPVYCSNCFRGKEDSNSGSSRSRGRDFGRNDSRDRDRGERKMFKTICTECGEGCEVPFNPSSDKPVLCSVCFEGSRNRDRKSGSIDNNQFESQFKIINDKLDAILKNFSGSISKISSTKEKVVVSKSETKKKAVETKKKVAKKPVKKVEKKTKK
ncbi:MAG: hypothetical protein PHZ07_04930 [Patescibacteria group bacterium]|nr:hypothetical protein [Patescibacteria group bacterium]MDD4304709.1 hypothetical protein [Patescibacteria group bacterium]MDD4695729.1 hypothetical protein [Patescibacteria group bacterium]